MFQHLDNNVLFTVSFVKFTLSDEQHREGKTRTCFLETSTPEMLVRIINLRCYRLEGINILNKCFPFYFLFNSAVKISFFSSILNIQRWKTLFKISSQNFCLMIFNEASGHFESCHQEDIQFVIFIRGLHH